MDKLLALNARSLSWWTSSFQLLVVSNAIMISATYVQGEWPKKLKKSKNKPTNGMNNKKPKNNKV